jgi:chorismate mutase/prephenate dehydratase
MAGTPNPATPNGGNRLDESALEPLRRQIDGLDERIVELLNERARVVVEVGKVKQQHNSPIYAPDRERMVLDKVRKLNHGPLPDRCLEAVYRELMSGSFALEKPLKIGFLGPAGTFSHAASVRKFGSSVEYVPLAEFPSRTASMAASLTRSMPSSPAPRASAPK